MHRNDHFRVGIGAIAWTNPGIPWFPDLYTGEEILGEMSELGYEGTEMNRKFPSELPELQAALEKHGLVLSSQFKSILFTDPNADDAEMESFRKHADFLKTMGCEHVIVCEMGGSMHWDPRRPNAGRITPLSDHQWELLTDRLHRAGEYCTANGMKLAYHFHAGTVIEQKHEIDRLMECTQAELVHLLLDTGHAYYGNYDPLELLQKYRKRVSYVHLKDVRKAVLRTVREERLNFMQGVDRGMFTVPGDGDLDFKPIFQSLYESAYRSWVIVEAEQHPGRANPYQYAKAAKQYIENLVNELRI